MADAASANAPGSDGADDVDGWWRTSASVRSELWRPGRSRALPVTRPAITFPNRGRRAMMSEKIRPHHLERKAILYVRQDRKSTRLNSSHANISYAVFCLKKKKQEPVICYRPLT